MLGNNQQGFLRYEERVRLERANGLREKDQCVTEDCGCAPHKEDNFVGMTYEELAKTPLKQNAVCPHTKVIVPITPAFLVEEPVAVIKAKYEARPYRVVDRNPCDGRTVMLGAIPHSTDVEVKHASTVEIHTTKVEDTMFDTPNEVKVVNRSVLVEENVAQPMAVNGTVPDNSITPEGKTKKKKNPSTEVV